MARGKSVIATARLIIPGVKPLKIFVSESTSPLKYHLGSSDYSMYGMIDKTRLRRLSSKKETHAQAVRAVAADLKRKDSRM